MHIYQKIQKVVNINFNKGEVVTRKQIVDAVRSEYPEVGTNCILPSDLCDNHKNKDPRSGKHKTFHKLDKMGLGKYKVL